jgi:hypothetical protein
VIIRVHVGNQDIGVAEHGKIKNLHTEVFFILNNFYICDMKVTKNGNSYIFEVSLNEKDNLFKIGQLIQKKQCKFFYFATDKLYYISDVKLES